MTDNDDTFVRITNKDIYKEIIEMKTEEARRHEEVVRRLDTTNGKVKLNRWIATTTFTLFIVILGYLIKLG